MTDEEFEKLVAAGIDALPEHVRKHMENVAVTIAEDVTPKIRKEQKLKPNQTLLGLYQGVPLTARGLFYEALPDKITIFKVPILEHYSDPEDIKKCVTDTVWHEVAHHFGFGEEWIRREERRRGKMM